MSCKSENIPSDMCVQRRLKSACTSAQSDQSLRLPHQETFQPWLSKMRAVKILIRVRNAQSDLNLHWAHISEGRFLDVTAKIKRARQCASCRQKMWVYLSEKRVFRVNAKSNTQTKIKFNKLETKAALIRQWIGRAAARENVTYEIYIQRRLKSAWTFRAVWPVFPPFINTWTNRKWH